MDSPSPTNEVFVNIDLHYIANWSETKVPSETAQNIVLLSYTLEIRKDF